MARDVTRALHYRHAGFLVPSQLTLEQLLRAAIAVSPLAVDRKCDLGQDVFQVFNRIATVRNTLCGSLHRWVHGQNQLIVEQDLTATSWFIDEVPPPAPEPGATVAPRRDFLPFSLYFGVRDNHVIVLQSQGMMAPELGQYLTWFIQRKVPHLTVGNQTVTMYPASAAVLRASGIDAAKSVCITKPLADLHERQPTGRKRKPWMEKIVPQLRAEALTDVLNALGIRTPRALLTQDDSKHLEVYLEIRRPHGKEPLGNPVMNEIGKLVAQQGGDDYSVELLDGSVLTGSNLILKDDVTLTIPDGKTHPTEMSIFRKIDEYLQILITTGRV
jgi:hypothetical protein